MARFSWHLLMFVCIFGSIVTAIVPPSGSRNCDLSGDWVDEHGHVIKIQQTQLTLGVSQTQQGLNWSSAVGNISVDTIQLFFDQDVGHIQGFVFASCQRIMFRQGPTSWQPDFTCPLSLQGFGGGCRWSRSFHHVKKVHMVYMTHWDTTFTDFRRGVCDVYFNNTGQCNSIEPLYCDSGNGHFVDAFNTSAQLRLNTSSTAPRFRYTTWPWLLKDYLDDTAECGTVARSPSETQRMAEAIARNDIIWNGKALNLLPEMADGDLYAFSLNISEELNSRFGKSWGHSAAKSADVSGVSRSIVPYLAQKGVTMFHLGYNAKCITPALPSIVNWAVGGTNVTLVISDTYGAESAIDPPGPVHHLDHTVGDGLEEALVFLYTPDNRAPPNASEVAHYWQATQFQFPNAVIEASSLDTFADYLSTQSHQFETFEGEIGDTWLNGGGSDPYRVAKFREIRRATAEAIEQGTLSRHDKSLQDYMFRLLNHPEHNWGLAGLEKYPNASEFKTCKANEPACYNNTIFHQVQQRADYAFFASSWMEGRAYLNPVADARLRREVSVDFDRFSQGLVERLQEFDHNFHTVIPLLPTSSTSFMSCTSAPIDVQFDPTTGALASVINRQTNTTFSLRQTGVPVYKTYNFTDYAQFDSYYNAGEGPNGDMTGPVSKPGIQLITLKSQLWTAAASFSLDPVTCTAQVTFDCPEEAHVDYGSPSHYVVSYQFNTTASSTLVQTNVSWVNKTATRLPEAIFFGFQPKVDNASDWRLDVMGYSVDPTATVLNGSRHLHAIQHDIVHPTATIRSLDVPLVSPGDFNHLLQNHGMVSSDQLGLESGWYFNLYNNHWGVAFPQWYPYVPQDANALFRFKLELR